MTTMKENYFGLKTKGNLLYHINGYLKVFMDLLKIYRNFFYKNKSILKLAFYVGENKGFYCVTIDRRSYS